MPCPCGSTKCFCDDRCFCLQINCHCSVCALLLKICPQCRLPCYVSAKEYKQQTCSCAKQVESFSSEARFSFQTTESDTSYESTLRRDECARCKLPIFLVATNDDDGQKVRYCRCPQKNRIANTPDIHSEHETSNSTSDHRELSADRQIRKTLSRKTRTQKSNWQAKKVKDRSSNSAEEHSYNTETGDTETHLADTSNPHLSKDDRSYLECASSGAVTDNDPSSDPDFIRSPILLSSRADETSTGNISLLVNTSGVSSQYTPEDLGKFQCRGFVQTNIRAKLPHPFPRLPDPIPGPPAFRGQQYQSPYLKKTPRPFLPKQAPVERKEKMEKWFETIRNVLNTSGELPDAETAATLDMLDKEHSKEEQDSSYSEELPHRGYVAAASDNGKDKDDIEPTTDTDRSSLSKSHKESESD